MWQNPALAQALIQDRVVELQSTAKAGNRPLRERRVIEGMRSATGWLLVDIGLRLTVPRRTMSHPAARAPQ